jgi:hypothetical protein
MGGAPDGVNPVAPPTLLAAGIMDLSFHAVTFSPLIVTVLGSDASNHITHPGIIAGLKFHIFL